MSGAVFAALAIVLGACASTPSEVAGVDEVNETVGEADSSPVDEPEEIADEDVVEEESSDGEAAEEEDRVGPPDFPETDFLADAPLLINTFGDVEVGDHRVLSLGTELSFTSEEALNVQPNFNGFFVVTDPDSAGPDEDDIVFLRTSNLSDPTQPWAPREEQEPWPVDDIAGWVDNLAADVIATDPIETTLGGFPAVYLELELADDAQCGFEAGSCIGFVANHDMNVKGLNPGSLYRVWVVDQGEEDPIVVTVGVLGEEDVAWFGRAEQVLSTLAFGAIDANPVRLLPAGSADLPALGGIEISFLEAQTISQTVKDRGYWSAFFDSSQLILVDEPRTLTGEVFATSDELIGSLVDAGLELTEGEETTVGGIAATAFDYNTAALADEILFEGSELDLLVPEAGWSPGFAGRILTIEHPERGLQVISANSTDSEFLEMAEEVIASIQYVDEN